jgi:hypothetical protein
MLLGVKIMGAKVGKNYEKMAKCYFFQKNKLKEWMSYNN